MNMNSGSSTANLAIYNTSGSLIGTTTAPLTSGHPVTSIYIGNNETGTSTGTSTFEDTLVDYTNGQWPLAPLVATSTPTFNMLMGMNY